MDAELSSPEGKCGLIDLPEPREQARQPRRLAGRCAGTPFWKASFDIAGRGFTPFTATVAVDEASLRPETTGKVRSSSILEEPDNAALVRVAEGAPSPAPPRLTGNTLVSRLFRHMLARDPGLPSAESNELLKERAEGLEDLLWILSLSGVPTDSMRTLMSKPAADISSTARPPSLQPRSPAAAPIRSGARRSRARNRLPTP